MSESVVKGSHVRLDLFGVGEHVGALLGIHPRNAVEQAPLESQGDGCSRLEDGLTGLAYVDILNCLARDAPVGGAYANGRYQPPRKRKKKC